jgi:hypothetical protein
MTSSRFLHGLFRQALACLTFLGVLAAIAPRAHARDPLLIRDYRTPFAYDVELEPHLVLGTEPPGPGAGSGIGIGVRGSVVLAPEGFIRTINDSIALGFGIDVGHYTGSWALNGYRDQCLHFEPGPNGTSICTDVTGNGGTYNYVYVPVVMQWNFWFTRRWSAFGEPGVNIYYVGNHGLYVDPAIYAGGRFHLSDRAALTLRLGYPTVTFGVSFWL